MGSRHRTHWTGWGQTSKSLVCGFFSLPGSKHEYTDVGWVISVSLVNGCHRNLENSSELPVFGWVVLPMRNRTGSSFSAFCSSKVHLGECHCCVLFHYFHYDFHTISVLPVDSSLPHVKSPLHHRTSFVFLCYLGSQSKRECQTKA